jgi:hypothetical protein
MEPRQTAGSHKYTHRHIQAYDVVKGPQGALLGAGRVGPAE